MVDPVNPDSVSASNPVGHNTSPPPFDAGAGGGGMAAFEKWLGPAGYAKFMSNLCQMINQEIAREQRQAKRASETLRKSETGQS